MNGFARVNRRRHVHCVGFVILSSCQVLRLCFIYNGNNDCNNLQNSQKSHLCILCKATQDKPSLFCYKTCCVNSIVFFEGTGWILTKSNYCRLSIHITLNTTNLTHFCYFLYAILMVLVNLRKKVSCMEALWRHSLWISLRKFVVSEDLHGELWTEFSVFFIKGNFLTRLFICEHMYWLHHDLAVI